MKEIVVWLDGRKVIVQYDEDTWKVKDNPLCETWPGDWSFRKVRSAVERYDWIIIRRRKDGPNKLSKTSHSG
ncbi:hypothetical protein FAY30_25965 (plasmid) [Bacillus sp. S3]|uniref:hypothetical protein n=1 Tax=Bacillus sp. S3 TaxID=486398 RepID=UPI00118AD080|nr:hypothetical protein [Bacillus sp. S3]QCJ45401.1 hypothetical protein FAY30_25965 [Bacillus sp. S3]